MKSGFTVTSQKPNRSPANGQYLPFRVLRKRGNLESTTKASCELLSSFSSSSLFCEGIFHLEFVPPGHTDNQRGSFVHSDPEMQE